MFVFFRARAEKGIARPTGTGAGRKESLGTGLGLDTLCGTGAGRHNFGHNAIVGASSIMPA